MLCAYLPYLVTINAYFIWIGDYIEKKLKHIGTNIRAARKRKNLTIDVLSELVGVSPSFFGTLERGYSSLSVETLINVCKALDVSADSIIFKQETTLSSPVDEKKDILFTMLINASDEELSFLIDYIKLYRKKVSFLDS